MLFRSGSYGGGYGAGSGQRGFGGSGFEYRSNPYGRRSYSKRVDDDARVPTQNFRYEDEDQTAGFRPGTRVSHAQFGPGTILSVEDLEDDQKVVVKFVSVGTKTLRARYAKLQRA